MKTNKLHTVLQKSLRIIVLLFALSLGANVVFSQESAQLLSGNGNSEHGGQWSSNGTAGCNFLKQRFAYLCNEQGSKYMKSLQRVSKTVGEAIATDESPSKLWTRRTCLSTSYKGSWMSDSPTASDYDDPQNKAIVYAYSIGDMSSGFDVYYYVDDKIDNDPSSNDDLIKPKLVDNAENLFQNKSNVSPRINNSADPLLETLDLSGWDFSGVTSLERFVSNCKRMTSISFGETVNLTSLTSAYQMFDGCPEDKVKSYFSDFISTWVVDVEWDDSKKEFVKTNNFSNGNTELLTNKSGKKIEGNIVTTKNDIDFKIKKIQGNNCALVNQDRPIDEFTSKISSAWIDTISDEIYISWDILYEQKIKKFVLEYSIDGGETYYEIDEIAANSQNDAAYVVAGYSYNWENIPLDFLRAKEYKIRIKMVTTEDNEIDEALLLPIELTYFEVLQNGNELFFEWETATETNNDYFTIEQSLDGVSFHEIARITGAGTTLSYTLYEYSYPISIEGIVYFRLKQTDYNGDYSYSNIKTIDVVGNSPLRMYPIPALAYITIEGDYESVQFVDVNGVIHTPQRAEGNTYPLTSFPKGMFFAIVTLKNGEIVTRQFLHK